MTPHVHYRLFINHTGTHADDSLIDYIPTFDGTPELYFDWIIKIENIAAVTAHNP